MPRPCRSDLDDGTYHVTARGVAEARIFLDDEDRRNFLRLLAATVERHTWRCHAFCLLGTHYHLVLEATRRHLSSGMHWLNGVYAQRFNVRHGRTGHVFGQRFWSSLLTSEEHLREACRYVLLNPVRAGLCAQPDEWPWAASRYGREAA